MKEGSSFHRFGASHSSAGLLSSSLGLVMNHLVHLYGILIHYGLCEIDEKDDSSVKALNQCFSPLGQVSTDLVSSCFSQKRTFLRLGFQPFAFKSFWSGHQASMSLLHSV